VWFLIGFSLVNAIYTVNRTRKYRLFEADVEKEQDTPSAHRVRVQSSPASASPLRMLTDMISPDSAESRAHPDRTRDVWELSVWDPLPICLQIFCLFSPGHVLVYMLFLPLAPLDARPSVTVFNSIVLQLILSAQLLLLQMRFSQQAKDTAIIQREVMHEYDTKFVHPRLYPTVRDAATQFSPNDHDHGEDSVEVGTPNTLLRRGFQTHPNLNYAKHIDPEGSSLVRSSGTNVLNPGLFTPPSLAARQSTDSLATGYGARTSALRRSTPRVPTPTNPSNGGLTTPHVRQTPAQSRLNQTQSLATSQQRGGYTMGSAYLGVNTHPNSPLKKTPSLGELQYRSPRNNREMAQLEQYQQDQQRERERSSSPVKSARKSTGTMVDQQPNRWLNKNRYSGERYPSMWQ
jgi:hypothetical protein